MYDFISTNKKTFCKFGKILFVIFAVDSIALYFYNLITVGIEYGISIIWQPLVSNVNSLGLGLIYLIISYMFAKQERTIVSNPVQTDDEEAQYMVVDEKQEDVTLTSNEEDALKDIESALDSEEYN